LDGRPDETVKESKLEKKGRGGYGEEGGSKGGREGGKEEGLPKSCRA
jgi:hypothetical protein